MFSFEQTLAAKALEEQQLHDHEPELGDKTPLLGGFAPALSSFEVTNRYAALEYLCKSSRQLCASDFTLAWSLRTITAALCTLMLPHAILAFGLLHRCKVRCFL